jgi:hypothetical protein
MGRKIYIGFCGGTPDGKRPLGRSRRRRKDTIKFDLTKIGCGGVDWIDKAWDGDQ